MAPTISQQRQIDALLAQYTPRVREAFYAAIYGARANVNAADLIAALQAHDIERAVQLLRIEQGVLFPLDDAVRSAFIAGGQSVVAPRGLSGAFSFAGRHWRAEQWAQLLGSTLIQGIQDDTLAMAQSVITAGLQEGFSPQKVQRELTGTLNRITGRREGGFLGLTAQQADSIIAGRAKLASGDPAAMREYLQLKLRDRRYDAMVKRAIKDGKPVAPADLETVITAHKNKALKYRGEMIAKNETFSAQAAGRDEAYRQMMDRADVADVTARWQHNLSQVPRLDHVAMDGTVISLKRGEVFQFPDVAMKHPHDPAGGAKHSVGCRCIAVYRVVLERD